jgi:tetratricopeptide (TPR) repeat protein
MRRLSLVLFIPLLLIATSGAAHTPAQVAGADPQAPEELPPDWQAYMKAAGVADPTERIRELQAVVDAHPGTPGMLASRQAILETTARNWPERTDQILDLARRFVSAAPRNARVFAADAAAQALLEAGVLLDDAEKLARAALADLGGADSQEPEQLARRAPYVATLGRVLAKKGRTREAEDLLKVAWASRPNLVAAPVALADIAESQGDDDGALRYLLAARLTGQEPGKTARRLEDLYRRLNGGSLDGLEQRLDQEYQRRFPNPIDAPRWTPADGGTGRILLLEVFTGTGCPPCVAMSLSVEAAMRRYGQENLSVISYHRHIPVVDPFSNVVSEKRAGEYDLITIPAVAIDGSVVRGGGSKEDAERYWSVLSGALEKRLAVPPEAALELDVWRDGDKVEVRAAVRRSKKDQEPLRLGLALVEQTSYSGESGIRFHPAVARDLVFEPVPLGGAPVSHVFDLRGLSASLAREREVLEEKGIVYPNQRDTIDPDRVRVVAFVQNAQTRDVLQSLASRPGATAPPGGAEAELPPTRDQ